jgi:hypothetical protein
MELNRLHDVQIRHSFFNLPIQPQRGHCSTSPANDPLTWLAQRGSYRSLKAVLARWSSSSAQLGARFPVRVKQIEDVRPDLGWITDPLLFPMSVNLPIRSRRRIAVIPAPHAYRFVCLVE